MEVSVLLKKKQTIHHYKMGTTWLTNNIKTDHFQLIP